MGWVAVGLFLAAKAGNIGTNHLFEAMVLDRLVALALGWLAIADAVTRPETGWWRSAISIAAATIIHPSVGLQLAMVLGTSWLAWALFGRRSLDNPGAALRAGAALIVAVIPGMAINLPQGTTLQGDLPASFFWILSVELQSPQHMLPHLWRMPQWLAWFELPRPRRRHTRAMRTPSQGTPDRLALRSIEFTRKRSRIASRLAIMLAVISVGLGAAWYAIEVRHSIRATVFQPFRMSTVVRGICLVLISGRIVKLSGASEAGSTAREPSSWRWDSSATGCSSSRLSSSWPSPRRPSFSAHSGMPSSREWLRPSSISRRSPWV